MKNNFLEQPIPLLLEGVPEGRGSIRGKTHGVETQNFASLQVAPCKARAAAWGFKFQVSSFRFQVPSSRFKVPT